MSDRPEEYAEEQEPGYLDSGLRQPTDPPEPTPEEVLPHVFGPCCDHHADDFGHLVSDAETRLARIRELEAGLEVAQEALRLQMDVAARLRAEVEQMRVVFQFDPAKGVYPDTPGHRIMDENVRLRAERDEFEKEWESANAEVARLRADLAEARADLENGTRPQVEVHFPALSHQGEATARGSDDESL